MKSANELKTQPAAVLGQAAVIRAKPAVLRATIHVTRKATGVVETFEIVGTPVKESQTDGDAA